MNLPQQNWCASLRPSSCGIAALEHAWGIINGSFQVQEQDILRVQQVALLSVGLPARVVAFGGLSPDQLKALCNILKEHGVPDDAVLERANAAVAQIGAGPVSKALGARVPWLALKAAASTPAANFKFVLPAELEAHVALHSQQKFGTAVKDARKKKQMAHHVLAGLLLLIITMTEARALIKDTRSDADGPYRGWGNPKAEGNHGPE